MGLIRPLTPTLALAVWTATVAVAGERGLADEASPIGPGERIAFRISCAHLLAGRARFTVLAAEGEGGSVLRFLAEAHSQGFFAWLFRFHVDDRTMAIWDSDRGCSLRIEKHLRSPGRGVSGSTSRRPSGGAIPR